MKKTKSLRGAKILITGGAGFIGSNLAEALLRNGAVITIIDAMIEPYGGNLFNLKDFLGKVEFVKGDVRSRDFMRNYVKGKNYVFHLAAQTGRLISLKNPKLDYDINCNGTLSVLEAISSENRKAKLIFSSSRGVIGAPVYLPVDENHPTNPRDEYGKNKNLAEQACFLYGNKYGFSVTSLRLNNVYGPKCQIKSNHYGTINLFIRYALEKKTLPIYGNGKQTRDYIYVSDAVAALIKAIDRKADGEFFFVGSGREYSLLEIAAFIKKEIKDMKYELIDYPPILKQIDFSRFVCSYKKINTILDWKPKISLELGIKETIKWYKNYLQYYL